MVECAGNEKTNTIKEKICNEPSIENIKTN